MKINQVNWYGFDHEKVSEHLSGDLTYLNDLCVNGEYNPVSVYRAKSPDRSKGHKDYVLLTDKYVRGMTKTEMKKWRYQQAVHCHLCDEVIYSVMRHDYRGCACGKVTVDGGKDYLKVGFSEDAVYEVITIDVLNRRVSKNSI